MQNQVRDQEIKAKKIKSNKVELDSLRKSVKFLQKKNNELETQLKTDLVITKRKKKKSDQIRETEKRAIQLLEKCEAKQQAQQDYIKNYIKQ